MSSYARKRVARTWRLFIALMLGVTLATTFFVAVNISADITARDALERSLEETYVDATVNVHNSLLTMDNLTHLCDEIKNVDFVENVEQISYQRFSLTGFEANFTWVNLIEGSRILKNYTLIDGNMTLNANETWVEVTSEDINQLGVGDVIPITITI
ncbi:MAG: hypothetical protein ACTSW4_06725, partial [Candidatus Ranarchaeia archaeon]